MPWARPSIRQFLITYLVIAELYQAIRFEMDLAVYPRLAAYFWRIISSVILALPYRFILNLFHGIFLALITAVTSFALKKVHAVHAMIISHARLLRYMVGVPCVALLWRWYANLCYTSDRQEIPVLDYAPVERGLTNDEIEQEEYWRWRDLPKRNLRFASEDLIHQFKPNSRVINSYKQGSDFNPSGQTSQPTSQGSTSSEPQGLIPQSSLYLNTNYQRVKYSLYSATHSMNAADKAHRIAVIEKYFGPVAELQPLSCFRNTESIGVVESQEVLAPTEKVGLEQKVEHAPVNHQHVPRPSRIHSRSRWPPLVLPKRAPSILSPVIATPIAQKYLTSVQEPTPEVRSPSVKPKKYKYQDEQTTMIGNKRKDDEDHAKRALNTSATPDRPVSLPYRYAPLPLVTPPPTSASRNLKKIAARRIKRDTRSRFSFTPATLTKSLPQCSSSMNIYRMDVDDESTYGSLPPTTVFAQPTPFTQPYSPEESLTMEIDVDFTYSPLADTTFPEQPTFPTPPIPSNSWSEQYPINLQPAPMPSMPITFNAQPALPTHPTLSNSWFQQHRVDLQPVPMPSTPIAFIAQPTPPTPPTLSNSWFQQEPVELQPAYIPIPLTTLDAQPTTPTPPILSNSWFQQDPVEIQPEYISTTLTTFDAQSLLPTPPTPPTQPISLPEPATVNVIEPSYNPIHITTFDQEVEPTQLPQLTEAYLPVEQPTVQAEPVATSVAATTFHAQPSSTPSTQPIESQASIEPATADIVSTPIVRNGVRMSEATKKEALARRKAKELARRPPPPKAEWYGPNGAHKSY